MSLIFLRNRVTAGGGAFTPASLFASGEEGAWYEPSTTTAFSDLEGFNFATYGQGVAHPVDKSKGATIEARRNLLAYTEEFDNAYWAKLNLLAFGSGSVANTTATTDPAGGNTAEFIVPNTTNAAHAAFKNPGVFTGTQYTISVYAKAGGYNWLLLANNVDGGVYVNLSDGSTGTLSAGFSNPTVTPLPNGWYRCSVTYTASATNRGIGVYVANADGGATFAGNGTSGIYIWGAQLETGSTATAYQKITTGQTISWLPGNHATQVTAGARPILARVPPRGRVNELSETDTLATQSVTVTAEQRTLSFKGTGTVTLSGASTAGPLVGTGAEDRVSLTFTPSSGTLTLTVLGAVTDAQLELGSAVTNYQFVADLLGYDITEAGVTSLDYLFDDEADDVLPWTAPADTDYTVAYVNTSGTVTILTAQSLSGATDILLDPALAGYVAVDRALTSQETTDLTAYLEALA